MSQTQAKRFAQTRQAHKSELAEDYVEVILELISDHGEARLTDISQRLGVAHPTVSKAMRKLQGEGLVIVEPYRGIKLTDAGMKLAKLCLKRHKSVVSFLVALGVDEETAESDAEGIEHHVSHKTLKAMERFAEKAKTR